MAKRKRLTPTMMPPLETKSLDVSPQPRRAPIAQVAGEAAATSALHDIASEMAQARSEGRLVQSLPLSAINADHLVRDRMVQDAEDMAALKSSLAARGQQTPIEVVMLEDGAYGLISGYRRLAALQALFDDTGDARFSHANALIKPLEDVTDSYVAMVEENEIRANLSLYERARLTVEAVRIGVFPTPAQAIATLFANASSTKRSKIAAFVPIHDRLGNTLRYPAAIPEKLGLALSKALATDDGFAVRVCDNLRKADVETVAEERTVLERSLKGEAAPAPAPTEIARGVAFEGGRGRVVLSGNGVTPELIRGLKHWLSHRA